MLREPDSTYFELPPGSQPGERPVPSTSTPGSHHSAAEGSMDVYHLRDMNDNVMVGTWANIAVQFVSLWSIFFFWKGAAYFCSQCFPPNLSEWPKKSAVFWWGTWFLFLFQGVTSKMGNNLFSSISNTMLECMTILAQNSYQMWDKILSNGGLWSSLCHFRGPWREKVLEPSKLYASARGL